MYHEILKKKKILEGRKPYSIELRKQLKTDELCDLIYTALHLDGSVFTKSQVREVLNGGYVKEATINDHLSIEHHLDVMSHIDALLSMDTEIDLRVIEEIHDILCGSEGPVWRKSNPVLYTLDYIPPHYSEVAGRMSDFIQWCYKADSDPDINPLLKAADIHNRIIEIYPFEYGVEATARVLMYYSLMRKGYPVFELRANEQEYNSAVIEYLKHKKIEPFYRLLERNLFNKLDTMLQITEPEL